VRKSSGSPSQPARAISNVLKLGGGGVGVLFISPKGEQLNCVFQKLFEVSNNEAEYKALLHGLRLAV
jgi:ribonuclease HI